MTVAPKRPKGPPLNAMRAFEAAARHVSFVSAAEELNVTPGAISQHVKSLEAWSEMPLFRRNAQGVVLTQAGQALVADFTAAFDGVANATRALRNLNPNPDFQIAALPSIAQLWLPKRLAKIRAQLPMINFSVTALETAPSLSRELFDLAIFFGESDGTANQISICSDDIVPVCSPVLLDRFANEGFDSLTLLHDQTWVDDWKTWCEAVEMPVKNVQNGPKFSLYSLAVEEAKAGAGALMGHLCLIDDLVACGELVIPKNTSCSTGKSLILQLPKVAQRRHETHQVAQMLI
ncbi:LysR family transcriptional regulator [Phaeobacter gallaeciensis]|uniref:LysR family transcriptional regulator n=3 Tax=Rhodobacterales TaxID=204455 RepID=A0A366WTU4_9RHOB|nr:LysR family transcriptional regulator [Falsiruegeria litorea]MBT3141000.1 LysR family transcriptional regulator [Falsiruegeria litorea]MBT8168109.1 LysR family transcriptional regulator [Falsiruegeria litorea]RBW52936.1 LysR family transcriptional regulator [Phaeobacter gallaeciensis]